MAKFTVAGFLREQRANLPVCTGNLASKAVMVVGSNVGLGLEAAIRLASLKPKWLLTTCRDEAKCKETNRVISKRAGVIENENANEERDECCRVSSWPLELSKFDSVRAFVDRFTAEAPTDGQLNVLIVSASLFATEYAKTSDGWETTVQVNYLSMALLSVLMLPYLVGSVTLDSPSRLVLISSVTHHWSVSKLNDAKTWTGILEVLSAKKFCGSARRYFMTKCLEIIFMRELAARLPNPTPVVVCAVNPGFCRSRLFRNLENKWYLRPGMSLLNALLFARKPEEGARAFVHAAIGNGNGNGSDDDERAMHGKYVSGCRIAEPDDFLFSPEGKEFSHRLWIETMDVLSKIDDRVPGIVGRYLSG